MITSTTALCLALIGLFCGLLFARSNLRNALNPDKISSTPEVTLPVLASGDDSSHALATTYSTTTDSSTLKPAEIAYLVRSGDTTHALIVVAVDLIQRAVKSTPDTTFIEGLADYERNMWRVVRTSVTDWAKQKAQETIVGGSKNPIQLIRRLAFLFNFVRDSLRTVVTDAIADPRRLKKYFSPNGVLRILADFTSAGYKQTFQEELRNSLLRRGLLVPTAIRHQVGRQFFIIGVIGVVASAVASFSFLPNIFVAFLAWSASLIAGCAGRIILSLRHMIPLYEELAVVADQVKRKSTRLAFVRVLLRSVNAILWIVLFFVVFNSCGLGLIFIKLIYPACGPSEVVAMLALTVTHFAIADFVFNGIRLNMQECPSPQAEHRLELVRKELADTSPLDTFAKLLATGEYDPKFSKLLALYGVETLLILF